MANINGYVFKELNNDNSGFSKWGFATKNGKEYFIKELLNPIYPMDASAMSPAMFKSRRDYCMKYETRFKNYYTAINHASCGNLVRIVEFFRCDTKYYVVTEKIDTRSVSLENIVDSPLALRLRLLKSAAYCFSCLHKEGIVHFDVKTANILVKRTRNGKYAAKLIDFDSGYFKNEEREEPELGGDLTYLAPETFLGIAGEDIIPDEKSDIFALGLVFHEYLCGKIPSFDADQYEYPYEAALDGGFLKLDEEAIPGDIVKLIARMLDADPTKRPSAEEVLNVITAVIDETPIPEPEPEPAFEKEDHVVEKKRMSSDSWFSAAGDL